MSADKGKITPVQYMFAIACFLQGSGLLTAYVSSISGQDTWIVALLAMVLCVPAFAIYTALMKGFPTLNMMQINDRVFGKRLGQVFSILYLLFFLTLTSLNLNEVTGFIRLTVMHTTPALWIAVPFMAVCALTVRAGLKVVVRYSFMFSMLSILVVVIGSAFMLGLMDIDNFLPVLDQPFGSYLQGANILLTIPFGEIVVIGMFFPRVEKSRRGVVFFTVAGFAIGFVTVLAIILRDTAVLGNALSLFVLPSFETLRMVTLTQTMGRMEVLFAAILLILSFFKVTLLYYVTAKALGHILGMEDYHPLVLSLGVVITIYAFIIMPSTGMQAEHAQRVIPLIWVVFEFLLPLITLVCARMRGALARPEAV